MESTLLLWILQVLLALAFLGAGVGHILNFDRMATQPRQSWVTAVGRERLRIIGVLEVLGAIGVVLPGATGVLPWLVPVAAASLTLLIAFAVVFHLRRPARSRTLCSTSSSASWRWPSPSGDPSSIRCSEAVQAAQPPNALSQRPFSYPVAVSLSQSEPALLFWM
jgi:uncharacterized membrane protein